MKSYLLLVLAVAASALLHPCRPDPPPDEEVPVTRPAEPAPLPTAG